MISVTDQVLRQGRRGHTTRPFLELAKVEPRGCSLPLQRALCDFAYERSFEKATGQLEEHYRVEVPVSTVTRVALKHARQAERFASQQPAPDSTAEQLIAEMDGSMLPIVSFPPKEEEEAADAEEEGSSDQAFANKDRRKQRAIGWKEIKLCSVRRKGESTARYGAVLGNAFEAGCVLRQTAVQSGYGEQTYVHGVGDGAPWIADQFDKQFGTQGKYHIDLYHVCEYLHEASHKCHGEQQTPKQWLKAQKKRLLENQGDQVIDALRPNLEAANVADDIAPVRCCLRYIENRRQHLDYKGARAKELPVGSGEIESAHGHVLQDRLKINGAWWLEENANHMAQMRVLRANRLWHSYWQNILAAA